jgi:ubiquinone/menaquinone biosynthesis C-methylase UbiE
VNGPARQAEFAKYERAYAHPKYRMKDARRDDAATDLAALASRGSYLDVSCGRGEMLKVAESLGFKPVTGTEIVAELIDGQRVHYAQAHSLPFAPKSFDVVTMFDVIEHLVPGDDEAACREMKRVARKHILLTANNKPSFNKSGDDLHINRRPYPEWYRLFGEWFDGCRVTWIRGARNYVSECWRVDL